MTEQTQAVELKTEENQEAAESSTAIITSAEKLNLQSSDLLHQLVNENDPDKVKDLTYLWNINQNKKIMARTDKCSDIIDDMVSQWGKRVAEHPDEMSHADLLNGIKTIQGLMERGQQQVAETNMQQDNTFIQINQTNTDVHVEPENGLNRESRERVKNAVMGLLANLNKATQTIPQQEDDAVDAEIIEPEKEDD